MLFLGMRAEAGDQGPCQKVDEEEIHDVGKYYCYESGLGGGGGGAMDLWTIEIEEDTIECEWPTWRACESKKLKRVRWQHPKDGSLPLNDGRRFRGTYNQFISARR